jgi:hypothetical protein
MLKSHLKRQLKHFPNQLEMDYNFIWVLNTSLALSMLCFTCSSHSCPYLFMDSKIFYQPHEGGNEVRHHQKRFYGEPTQIKGKISLLVHKFVFTPNLSLWSQNYPKQRRSERRSIGGTCPPLGTNLAFNLGRDLWLIF